MLTEKESLAIRRHRMEESFALDPMIAAQWHDGNTYRFEYDNRAMKEIYKDTGLNLLERTFTQEDMRDPNRLSSLVFHALTRHHPDMTREQADRMISFRHVGAIMSILNRLIDLYLPDMSDLESAAAELGIDKNQEDPAPVDPT